jgi:hypothetical protein
MAAVPAAESEGAEERTPLPSIVVAILALEEVCIPPTAQPGSGFEMTGSLSWGVPDRCALT